MDTNSQQQMKQQDLLSFDPVVIILDVLKQWLLVVIVVAVVAVGAFILRDSSYQPVYQSNATLVVTTRSSYSSVYKNIDSTNTLASVFTEILNSSLLRAKVLEEAGISSFGGRISASVVSNTNLLTLRVEDKNPRTAFLVMKAVIENHEVVTYNVIGDIVIEVLQTPKVPTAPVNRDDTMQFTVRAAAISGIAVCLLLAFLSFRRDAVRSRSEAERKLDCWCLGEIRHENKYKTLRDCLKHRKKGILITRPDTGFQYVSMISKLRQRVVQHMHGGRVLIVTSVMENEGKSTVAANLALELARKQGKVLLLDCDLHKPAVHKLLDLEPGLPAIQDVLTGAGKLQDSIVEEKHYGLHILPARKANNKLASELITSNGLKELLQVLRQHYRYIVVDMPPMSVSTDTECVMELADDSLLVVRQNQCTAPVLNRAISALQDGRAKLLGCVINDVYSTFLSTGAGYDAGYGRYDQYSRYSRYAGKRPH